jgi:hypothetical protein
VKLRANYDSHCRFTWPESEAKFKSAQLTLEGSPLGQDSDGSLSSDLLLFNWVALGPPRVAAYPKKVANFSGLSNCCKDFPVR